MFRSKEGARSPVALFLANSIVMSQMNMQASEKSVRQTKAIFKRLLMPSTRNRDWVVEGLADGSAFG